MADNPLLDGSGADQHADGGLPCPLFKNNSNWGGGAYQVSATVASCSAQRENDWFYYPANAADFAHLGWCE